MNTIIVYATRYGCTEKCANILSEKLKGKPTTPGQTCLHGVKMASLVPVTA